MLRHDSRVCPLRVNLHGTVPSLEVKTELSLIDPRSNAQFDRSQVFHCDGLLLCTSNELSMLVAWNPCTGQTRWIKAGRQNISYYSLGYYQASKSSSKSYKILNVCEVDECSEIYEFCSDSWRIIDHDRTRGLYTSYGGSEHIVSLNGKTYWLAADKRETHRGEYLLGFDFSSEKSSPLVRLSYQRSTFEIVILSVVREEKLSVLLQRHLRSKTEIWVTSTIDGTKPVSWSKVLALDLSPDLQISTFGNFLLDEEKKVALCCERLVVDVDVDVEDRMDDTIYCVGEDNKVTQVYFRADTTYLEGPELLSYVPSLVQIEPVGSNKRKRGD